MTALLDRILADIQEHTRFSDKGYVVDAYAMNTIITKHLSSLSVEDVATTIKNNLEWFEPNEAEYKQCARAVLALIRGEM